jgi:hypothetical protein
MRVLLINDGSCEQELRQARAWLEAQECEAVILDVGNASEENRKSSITSLVDQCDVVVLFLTSSLQIIDVQISVLAAKAKGKKIVGIQLSGSATTDEFEKFGSALLQFDQKKLIAAVCGDYAEWTDDEGDPRPEPETERHKCKKPTTSNAAA